jgi:putative sterol carrier protein
VPIKRQVKRNTRSLPAAGALLARFDLETYLAAAGPASRVLRYAGDQVIFSQGDAAPTVKYIQKGSVKKETSFYFSLGDDEKWTVLLGKDKCTVAKGKTEDADCFFKASEQMFLDVWNGTYTPSAKDFLLGPLKSNNPLMLTDFVAAFQKK